MLDTVQRSCSAKERYVQRALRRTVVGACSLQVNGDQRRPSQRQCFGTPTSVTSNESSCLLATVDGVLHSAVSRRRIHGDFFLVRKRRGSGPLIRIYPTVDGVRRRPSRSKATLRKCFETSVTRHLPQKAAVVCDHRHPLPVTGVSDNEIHSRTLAFDSVSRTKLYNN